MISRCQPVPNKPKTALMTLSTTERFPNNDQRKSAKAESEKTRPRGQPSLRLDFLACDTEEVGAASFCSFQKGALAMHVVDPTLPSKHDARLGPRTKSKPE